MCLHINLFTFQQTAKEDIIVYKVIQKYQHVYYSPYYTDHRIIFDTLLTSELNRDTLFTVEDGYHSFATERAARNERAFHEIRDSVRWSSGETNRFKVIKCIIPKGSKYYKGKFDGEISYASDQLIFTTDGIYN